MILRTIVAAAALLLLQGGVANAQIHVDDKAARAVLTALGKPDLTKAEALTVAHLPGNQAIVRKLRDLSRNTFPASEDGFADALVAAAHGDETATRYGFARVKKDRATTLKLMDEIDAHPEAFVGWIEKRIAPFTPAGLKVEITGYLVAGGSADGFAFENPDFYMNISRFGDEIGSARVIMVHELYHGVQNLVARQRPEASQNFDFDHDAYAKLTTDAARDCYATRAYFTSLVAEGTATLVGDPDLLPKEGAYATAERQRRADRTGNLESQRTLLEMSMKGVTAPNAIDEESVYGIGFYNTAPMYNLGFTMAKSIADADGEAAIGRLISEPPERFVQRYIALSKANSKLPPLGPETARWAARATCSK